MLFVLEYFHPHVGGAETLFGQLTTSLAAQGVDVTVVTSSLSGAPPRETWNGVRVIREPVPRHGARYFFTLKAIPRVARLARTADLVHTTTYNAAIPGWIGARLARRPVVVTVHEVWAEQWTNLLGMRRSVGLGYRAFEWLVLHLPFTRYHCDSEFTARRLHDKMDVDRSRVDVVYPAVDYGFWEQRSTESRDFRRTHGLDDATFLFCYFGRPGVSKGLEYLIDAAAALRRSSGDWRLVLVLARDPLSQYRRLLDRIRSVSLDDRVIVLDPVSRDELRSLLLSMGCVVVPSVSEGFGYSAVEAATLGLPVIATTGHSVEEVLPSATFVAPRDPEALADAMEAMEVGDATSRPRTPPSGRRFDVSAQTQATLAAYASMSADTARR